jgi:nucleoside-diphosphate-sugar epimerase
LKVLVVGGTGFIGPAVVKELRRLKHEVAVYHRGNSLLELPGGVVEILGDRDDLPSHRQDFAGLRPDVVLNMIAYTKQHAVDAVESLAGIARRMVVISSQDVYRAYGKLIGIEEGEPDPMPLAEDAPLRSRLYPYRSGSPRKEDDPARWMDDYDKILVEEVAMNSPDLPGTILRLPMVYGPRDRQHRIFEWLRRMDDVRPAILLEKALAGWRWSRGYVENVAHAIVIAGVNEKASGKIYNVADGNDMSMADWVGAIGHGADWNGRVVTVSSNDLPKQLASGINTDQDLVVDTGRIRDELNYEEIVSLDDAIFRTIAWERENPPDGIDQKQFDYEAEDRVLEKLAE